MRQSKSLTLTAAVLAVLSGCATPPLGPRAQVLPAPNKPFEVFQQEQLSCKQYADAQVAGQADAANEKAVGTALLGGLLGAGLGAAFGGGHGAGVGAATGGVMGSAVGAGNSQQEQMGIQQRYDNAYMQCMYSKGNQVVPPAVRTVVQPVVVYPPPPVVYAPPPGYVAAPPPVVYAPPPGTAAPPPAMYAPPPGTAAPPPPPDMPPPPPFGR